MQLGNVSGESETCWWNVPSCDLRREVPQSLSPCWEQINMSRKMNSKPFEATFISNATVVLQLITKGHYSVFSAVLVLLQECELCKLHIKGSSCDGVLTRQSIPVLLSTTNGFTTLTWSATMRSINKLSCSSYTRLEWTFLFFSCFYSFIYRKDIGHKY